MSLEPDRVERLRKKLYEKAKQEPDNPDLFQPHWEYWRASMGEWLRRRGVSGS